MRLGNLRTRSRLAWSESNVPIPVPMAFHSFGGWKASIFGDHYMHGPEGVRFYTRLKTITSRWPTGIRAGAEFVMPYHVLIAATGPLRIQAVGTVREGEIINRLTPRSQLGLADRTEAILFDYTENDGATFVLRSDLGSFGRPDQKDIGRDPRGLDPIICRARTRPLSNRQRACAIQNDRRGFGSRYRTNSEHVGPSSHDPPSQSSYEASVL